MLGALKSTIINIIMIFCTKCNVLKYSSIKNKDIKAIEILIEEHFKKPRMGWENIFNDDSEYKYYFK